jgi:serine/threonine protein kinase/WD40 repeat protein
MEPTSDGDDYADLLAACDELLAAGTLPAVSHAATVPDELRDRLARDVRVLRGLRVLLPVAPAGPPAPFALGRFEVRRELGRGTYGVVLLAFDPHLCREVAVKVPRPEVLARPGLREAFLREARAAAAVEHEHVVPVHDVGEADGLPFLVMPLLRGETLQARLRREGTLPVPEALRIAREAAGGLAAAHARGLVHRDVKPANVWLEAGRGSVRVLDFGLARAAVESASAADGTPAYMAPEQADGGEVGPAADVYALGAVLYEAMTGRPPFSGESVPDLIAQVCTRPPVPPSRFRSDVPAAAEAICLKCLEKDPARRYTSAAELADDLGQVFDAPAPPGLTPGDHLGPVRAVAITAAALLLLGGVLAFDRGSGKRESAAAPDATPDRPTARPDPLLRTIRSSEPVADFAFHPDGRRLAVLTRRELRVWDVVTGYRIAAPRLKLDWYLSLSYSPDGKYLAAGNLYFAQLWDAESGEERLVKRGLPREVRSVSFSPNGGLVASAVMNFHGEDWQELDGCLRVWDPATGKDVRDLDVQGKGVNRAVFDRGGRRLTAATGLWNPTTRAYEVSEILVWDVATWRLVRSWSEPFGVYALAISPDGEAVAYGGTDPVVRVRDVRSGRELFSLGGHVSTVMSVAIHPGGKWLVTGDGRGTVRVWDATTGKLRVEHAAFKSGIQSLKLSPDGSLLAADADRMVKVWDFERLLAGP